MLERVAVVIGQGSLCSCADVCEDERGACLGREPFEVFAVPGGEGGGEYAWVRAEFGGGVEADSEPVTVDWSACILPDVNSVCRSLILSCPG